MGRKLLLDCLAVPLPAATPVTSSDAQQARRAQTELDNADELLFARVHAALQRFHPEVCEFVFQGGLKASHGLEAVHGVATLLSRLDALENGSDPGRRASRKEDKMAVALLAARGIPPSIASSSASSWASHSARPSRSPRRRRPSPRIRAASA